MKGATTITKEQTRWKDKRFQRCRRKLVDIVARGLKKAKNFAKLKVWKELNCVGTTEHEVLLSDLIRLPLQFYQICNPTM